MIKLCRPSMEKDTDSLLERVRDLESKLENGMVVAAQQGMDGKPYGGQKQVRQEQPDMEMPKAVPEDV